jgi:hydrogenase expression/formation protein HypC
MEDFMCLGVPMQVISLEEDEIMAEIDGVKRRASIALLDHPLNIGDYVIVHAGFAIAKLDEEEARETLALMRDLLTPESMG